MIFEIDPYHGKFSYSNYLKHEIISILLLLFLIPQIICQYNIKTPQQSSLATQNSFL